MLNDYVIRSDDLGITWQAYLGVPRNVRKIFFRDKFRGWAVGGRQFDTNIGFYSDVIIYTTDGGVTWEVQLDSIISRYAYGLSQVYFYNDSIGISLGYSRRMWFTTNGGKLWIDDTSANYPIIEDDLIDVAYLTKTTLLGVGWLLGNIYKYTDEPVDVVDYYSNDENLFIYPNPVKDKIKIKLKDEFINSIEFKIFNSYGQVIITKSATDLQLTTNDFRLLEVDVSSISSGVYFAVINENGKVNSIPFLVLR
jgi:hypothetical protein